MKIAIVNDLAMAVEALRRALARAPAHELIWVARDGAEAVAMCSRTRPDLILMDLIMPVMDGVEATRRIMAETPCAILLVTANVGANASRVFEAMGHGALDAVDTPSTNSAQSGDYASALLSKIDTIDKLIGDGGGLRPRLVAASRPVRTDRMLALGASAGGPAALATLLRGLPQGFPAAIVIVQHVDALFAPGMAEWLAQYSPWPVRVAQEGERPLAGTVLLAGSNDHLVLKAPDRLGYTTEPHDLYYRPSIDVFFESVAVHWPGKVLAGLLTGMGRDGAAGLKALRDKGHYTVAQDQGSSAVYGMPKVAAEMGAASDILALQQIAARLSAVASETN